MGVCGTAEALADLEGVIGGIISPEETPAASRRRDESSLPLTAGDGAKIAVRDGVAGNNMVLCWDFLVGDLIGDVDGVGNCGPDGIFFGDDPGRISRLLDCRGSTDDDSLGKFARGT